MVDRFRGGVDFQCAISCARCLGRMLVASVPAEVPAMRRGWCPLSSVPMPPGAGQWRTSPFDGGEGLAIRRRVFMGGTMTGTETARAVANPRRTRLGRDWTPEAPGGRTEQGMGGKVVGKAS